MSKMRTTLLLLATLAVASCNQGGRYRSAGKLDDGLLQYTSPERQQEISAARMDLIESEDATAAAKHRASTADADRKVLSAELKDAKERVAREEERTRALAEAEMDSERITEADEALAEARKAVEVAQGRLDLHDAKVQELEAQVELAEAEQAHAAAVVDLRKARALAALERPETEKIDVAAFERVERERETVIEHAKLELRSAQREVSVLEEQLFWEE